MKKHFSIRIESEILSKIDRIAVEEERTRGAVIRRIIRTFFKEEPNENNRRENDRPGDDVGIGGGL